MNNNIILADRNRADAAVLANGDFAPTLPLKNLQTQDLEEVARSTSLDLADCQLTITSPKVVSTQLLALVNHNLTQSATIRWVFYDDADVVLLDTGSVNVWPVVVPLSQADFHEDNFLFGTLPEEDLEGWRRVYWLLLPEALRWKKAECYIDDSNNPAGYIQAGRLWISPVEQQPRNFGYGNVAETKDNTKVVKDDAARNSYDVLGKTRRFKGTIRALTKSQSNKLHEMQRRVGLAGEVFIIPNPSDINNAQFDSFLGSFVTISPVGNSSHGLFSVNLDVEEKF